MLTPANNVISVPGLSAAGYTQARYLFEQAMYNCYYDICAPERIEVANQGRIPFQMEVKYDEEMRLKAWRLIKQIFASIQELLLMETLEDVTDKYPALTLASMEAMVGKRRSMVGGERLMKRPLTRSDAVDAGTSRHGDTDAKAVQMTLWSAIGTFGQLYEEDLESNRNTAVASNSLVRLRHGAQVSIEKLTKVKPGDSDRDLARMFYRMVRKSGEDSKPVWCLDGKDMYGQRQLPCLLLWGLHTLHSCMAFFQEVHVMRHYINQTHITSVYNADLETDLVDLFKICDVYADPAAPDVE